MLTDHEIELAARKLCELTGKDPDDLAEWNHIDGDLPFWTLAAHDIRKHEQISEAISFAREHSATSSIPMT